MKFKKVAFAALVVTFTLAGCTKTPEQPNSDSLFTYETTSFSDTIGSKTNNEKYDYDKIIVNPISNLREDFAMGVDGSMIESVLENGGVYYNEEGKEQDVYQIMARNGVNFFRVRLWNKPSNLFGDVYGGGNVDTAKAIKMSKKAQAANMNILVDLHYSDFWADPATQRTPTAWSGYTLENLASEVERFTAKVLNDFKNAGVNVQAVQIGNEINNGLLFPVGKIDWSNATQSYKNVSTILKAGIKGAKSVNPNILTMIHLAEGGSFDIFNSFFSAMATNEVNYDLIGASYYPFYHGSLANLQNNLNNTANKFKKPVIVAETSYGFTTADSEHASHIYNAGMEDGGKYLTSIQGQATLIRDVVQVLADVPEKRGAGIFYWEPAWLPVEGAGWATAEGQAWTETGDANDIKVVADFKDGKATWSNQALFSYNGRMLPSLKTFKLMRGKHNPIAEVAVKARTISISLTLNIAAEEKLPSTYLVETNLDAIRPFAVEWNASESSALSKPGSYIVTGRVENKFPVVANVVVIENYVLDPSFENQGSSDRVVAPWVPNSDTHPNEVNKVAKLNRKAGDVRTGTTNFNWYHGSQVFHFKVSQEIILKNAGTYELSAYINGPKASEMEHMSLEIFVIKADGTRLSVDMKNVIDGWSSGYKKGVVNNITILANEKIVIGVEGRAAPTAWGHADDFSLIKVS